MKVPERIDMKAEELDALVARVKSGALREGDSQIIETMAETIKFLSSAVDQKSMSIERLRRILFGAKTERTKNVFKEEAVGKSGKKKKKRKGHGRMAADAYTGAKKVEVEHESLKAADNCPLCLKGKVYPMKVPGKVLWIVGKAPLEATVYELEKLRCNLCGEVFTAECPEKRAGEGEKYEETASSMIALLKYGSGFPFNRLENLQKSFGVPMAASTQWEIVERKANKICGAYEELVRQAAQGEVLHNDDTNVKILEFMKEQDRYEAAKRQRTGMFTTAILSRVGPHTVALYYTGRKHAGENMADVLENRQSDRGPPIQMCDALSRNLPKPFKVILANCLSHARRKFVDVTQTFPEESRLVIELLRDLYKNEAEAKQKKLSDNQRLEYNQEHSEPLMNELKEWLEEQFDQKKVEPNSSLGEAISYMSDHWKELTLFLREPGAPLDNNICEQALKRAILHRKNALFFKTQNGAYIADIYMSLIHTCTLAGADPFDYLTELERNGSAVQQRPQQWLPWNYERAPRR
jgi:transposase